MSEVVAPGVVAGVVALAGVCGQHALNCGGYLRGTSIGET